MRVGEDEIMYDETLIRTMWLITYSNKKSGEINELEKNMSSRFCVESFF